MHTISHPNNNPFYAYYAFIVPTPLQLHHALDHSSLALLLIISAGNPPKIRITDATYHRSTVTNHRAHRRPYISATYITVTARSSDDSYSESASNDSVSEDTSDDSENASDDSEDTSDDWEDISDDSDASPLLLSLLTVAVAATCGSCYRCCDLRSAMRFECAGSRIWMCESENIPWRVGSAST